MWVKIGYICEGKTLHPEWNSGNGGHLFGGHFRSILQIGHFALVGFSKYCLLD